MPRKPRITAWSYSRYQVYKSCPFKAHCKFNLKLKEPSVPQMERGIKVHKDCELYLNEGGRIKKEMKLFTDEFKELRALKAVAEAEWAFTNRWSQTGWFDKNVWLRTKIDALVDAENTDDGVLRIIDAKTGKPSDDNKEQLELYGVSGFSMRKKVKKIRTELWYLDQGVIHDEEFDRKHFVALKKMWQDKVRPMMNDNDYVPRPSYKCKWCAFSKDSGGPCEFRGD